MGNRDVIGGAIAFLFALGMFVLSFEFTRGSELFPRLIAGLMLVSSAALVARGILRPAGPEKLTEEQRIAPDEFPRIGVAMGLTVLYVALIAPLGFVTATVLYLPLTAYALGLRRHLMIWLTTLIYVGAVYFLFARVFRAPLPPELILKLF